MKIFFTFLLLLSIKVIFSQSLIYPALPSDEITGVHYLNDKEIIFINAGGSIYKSYDGGMTWQLKKYYPNNYLAEMEFLDDKIGFVRTQNSNLEPNVLIYTNDGGETWNENDVSIYTVNSFLPVSQSVLLKATTGSIQRLDNFYNDWKITYNIPTFTDSGYDYTSIEPYGSIKKLLKLDNGNIIALGTNENAFYHNILDDSLSYILKSKDLGLTWDTLWIGLKDFINEIVFVNDSTGWMISDTSLFKSSNGGRTWSIQNAINDGTSYKGLYANGDYIYLLTYYNKFIKSTNSGVSWSINDFNFTNLSSTVFNDDNNGFVFGEGLYKTNNSGQSWENLNKNVRNDIYDLCFLSTTEGIAFGNNGVYKTYDGGNSWVPKFNPGGLVYNNPGSLEMLNDSIGWLITYHSIYKTVDRGESWVKSNFYEPNQIYNAIEFYNGNLGILKTSAETNPGSRIYDISNTYISTDSGTSWTKRKPDSLYFDKLKFTDPNHLWGISQTGLYVSYDTARTWKKIYGDDYFIGSWSFDFYDSLFGVVTTSYDQAYFTYDGGFSWKAFNKPVGNHPTDCKILGPDVFGTQRILEAGSDGKLLLTYLYPNGDVKFSYQMASYTRKKLNKIEVLIKDDFPNVWVAGDGFTILYRQFEKIFTNVKKVDYQQKDFALYQNYPNPFNPTTRINYSIPKATFVTVKVYDVLGREVRTLVNKNETTGNYSVNFNASNLSSGIYFYRLKAADYVQTRKMILLK